MTTIVLQMQTKDISGIGLKNENLFSENQKNEMRFNIHEWAQHLFPAYLHAGNVSTVSKKKINVNSENEFN
jgi:hypothetical protein